MCLDMSDYVGGQWISVCVCVYIFVSIAVVLLASSQILCDVWNNVQRHVPTYPRKGRCVHAGKQLLSPSHAHKHMHIHFLW